MSTISELSSLPPPIETTRREDVGPVQVESQAPAAAATPAQVEAPKDSFALKAVGAASVQEAGATELSPSSPPAPTVEVRPETADDAKSYSAGIGGAMSAVLTNGDGSPKNPADISEDDLMRAFMQLNILNPDENVQAKNDLNEALSKMREQAIRDAQAAANRAAEAAKEAEKKNKFWQGVSDFWMVANPMGRVAEMLGSEPGDTWMTILAPEQSIAHSNMTDETELQRMQSDAQAKSMDAAGQQNLLTWSRLKEERESEELYAKMSAEAASIGEDGVPAKTLAKKIQPKLQAAMQSLWQLGQTEGAAAMMEAAPKTIRDALVPALKEAGVSNPEALAAKLAPIFEARLTQHFAQKLAGERPSEALGQSTTMLAHALDPDREDELPKTAGALALEANRDAAKSLEAWSETTINAAREHQVRSGGRV